MLTAQAQVCAEVFDQQALVTCFLRGLKATVRAVLRLERKKYVGSHILNDFIERAASITRGGPPIRAAAAQASPSSRVHTQCHPYPMNTDVWRDSD